MAENSKKGNFDGHKCHKISKKGNILMASILKCVIKSEKSEKILIGQKTKITSKNTKKFQKIIKKFKIN